jgi:sugar phosphate isomerase/epimerase
MNNKPVLGTTLYSFTNEWLQRLFTFDQLVEKVAKLRLGPAVEVVGFQSFRTFPDVTDEFASHFRNLFDRHGLIPSCLGANCDIGRQRNRLMTTEEIVIYLERQIVSAKKLGFPVMRIQAFVGPKVFEKIAPIAEKAGVHVACELHSPLSIDNPEVVALRECFDRVGSAYIGFIPDFSSTMTNPPNRYWDSLRARGAPEGLIEAAKTIWVTDKPNPEKYSALAEAGVHFGASEGVAGQLNMVMTMFGHMSVENLAELLPYTRHIHGKFYEVDSSGKETSIPYPEIMSLLKKEGYHGTISAEWEGHAFTEETIGFQQVQAWHTMCRRLLALEA